MFPNRVNVEFVQLISRTRLKQRTWERGTGETLACGSGACAVGVAAMLRGVVDRRVEVELRGGLLVIDIDQEIPVDLAKAGIIDIGAERQRLVGRPDRPGNKARATVGGGEANDERRAARMGYRGDYSFEVFNDDYQQMPLDTVAQRAYRSALWLGEDVLRRSVPLPGTLRLREPRQG